MQLSKFLKLTWKMPIVMYGFILKTPLSKKFCQN